MISSYYITDLICNNKNNIDTTKNFKLSDFKDNSASKHYTKNTIFTIAVMEWLLNGDLHTKKLMQYLYKYYKLYPECIPNRYGKGLDTWLSSGAKWYRADYECSAIAWCGIIAFIVDDMNALKILIRRAVKATNNSEIAIKYSEMLAVAMYLNKKYKSIDKTLTYLKKHYDYELCDDIDEFTKTYKFTSNAKPIAFAGLNCLFHSIDYYDCISKALRLESNSDIIVSIAGLLAESLYGFAPADLSYYYITYLPKEFLEVMFKFDEFKLNTLKENVS